MGIPILQIDAFTDKPFAGNPAAVCILSKPRDAGWMQQVAAEMNLSETAFLHRGDNGFNLRWFTPAVEVDLCGHATLASAHALWETGRLRPEEEVRFHTRSGLLTARRAGDWIELDFPAEPAFRIVSPPELVAALGFSPEYIGKNRFDYIVELDSETTLRNLRPDFALLGEATDRGVIVTSPSDSAEYDFVSRFFAPAVGIDEDPVTGSAHCCLAPFWRERLNKDELTAYQTSRRGGVVRMSMRGNRVLLGGQAVTVFHGELVSE